MIPPRLKLAIAGAAGASVVLGTLAAVLMVARNELDDFNPVLTNLVADVAAELGRRGLQPLRWSDAEPPTRTDLPRAVDSDWAFLGSRLTNAPARLAVWTIEGPGGATWVLVAEATLETGGRTSNRLRRAVGPGARFTVLPADWSDFTAP